VVNYEDNLKENTGIQILTVTKTAVETSGSRRQKINLAYFPILKMEAISSSETSDTYRTIRCYNPEEHINNFTNKTTITFKQYETDTQQFFGLAVEEFSLGGGVIFLVFMPFEISGRNGGNAASSPPCFFDFP
jgi:hypothetical protein